MKLVGTWLAAFACLAFSGCMPKEAPLPPPPPSVASYDPLVSPKGASYVNSRKEFQTTLFVKGPSPQHSRAFTTPPDVHIVEFKSGDLKLKAWTNLPTSLGQPKKPAIVFCHGGYAFDVDDWNMTKPLRDAGFIVMAPILRGENGQPGEFTMFLDEVDDVVAAGQFLALQYGVDPKHMFVCGHSVGGTLAMLTAMYTNEYKAGASFSGSPDQMLFCKGDLGFQPPFDTRNPDELAMRSPLAFPTSFQCPFRIYRGDQELFFSQTSPKLAKFAQTVNLDVKDEPVPGNHTSAVPEEMARAIAFFKSQK